MGLPGGTGTCQCGIASAWRGSTEQVTYLLFHAHGFLALKVDHFNYLALLLVEDLDPRLHIESPFGGRHPQQVGSAAGADFPHPRHFHLVVETADSQVPAPQEGLEVGKLENPGSGASRVGSNRSFLKVD